MRVNFVFTHVSEKENVITIEAESEDKAMEVFVSNFGPNLASYHIEKEGPTNRK